MLKSRSRPSKIHRASAGFHRSVLVLVGYIYYAEMICLNYLILVHDMCQAAQLAGLKTGIEAFFIALNEYKFMYAS